MPRGFHEFLGDKILTDAEWMSMLVFLVTIGFSGQYRFFWSISTSYLPPH